MKFENPKKCQGWIKATRYELRQLINSGTFDKNVVVKDGEPVMEIMETNKIKLNQHGNLDNLNVRMCIRGDIQKMLCPDMEDTHSPAAAFRMLKMFNGLAAQKKAEPYQGDVVGAFLQAVM